MSQANESPFIIKGSQLHGCWFQFYMPIKASIPVTELKVKRVPELDQPFHSSGGRKGMKIWTDLASPDLIFWKLEHQGFELIKEKNGSSSN